MNEQSRQLLKMVASLTGFSLLAALLLGGVHSITRKPIAESQHRQLVTSVASVLPPFVNDPLSARSVLTLSNGHSAVVYPAFAADSSLVGAAVESCVTSGFSGEIKVLYGFDAGGVVTGYSVLSHAETPGLGARMNEWFRSPEQSRSVIGFAPATGKPYITKDGGDIDGITAATISSRAFMEALREAFDGFKKFDKNAESK